MITSWFIWALLAAVFAALTAIFTKLGVAQINSDLATLIRTFVVFALLIPFVLLTGKWSNPLALPGKALLFLVISALATGASWVCYFRALQLGPASQVASIDKLSVVLVAFFAVLILGELGIALVGAGALILSIAATR